MDHPSYPTLSLKKKIGVLKSFEILILGRSFKWECVRNQFISSVVDFALLVLRPRDDAFETPPIAIKSLLQSL